MSWVLILLMTAAGFLEMNTYDTLESCEAAASAALTEWKQLNKEEWLGRGEYHCIPKPD